MAKAITRHKGLVLQYIGDEIEAAFGAPLSLHNPPKHALNAAIEMRRCLLEVNSELEKQGYGPICHGIGIHTGKAVAAIIGSPDRLSYSLVGDTVNLASRIQNLNKKFGTDILISAETQAYLSGDHSAKSLGEFKLEGIESPIEIFKII